MTPLFSASLTLVNSAPRISLVSEPLLNTGVATIDQIYRENLRLLAAEAGGVARLSARIGKSPAQLSQWINASKDSKTGKPRAMSRAMAREIERKTDKPEGWMDQLHVTVQEPPAEYQIPKGQVFEALTPEEQVLLDNFRVMLDDDQRQFAEEISSRAARMRAYTDKLMRDKFGAGAKPAKSSIDATKTRIARAALDVTDQLRQQSLFDGKNKPKK